MKCDYCNNSVTRLSRNSQIPGGICNDCQIHIYGKIIINSGYYDREWTDGNIIIWILNDKVVEAWVNNGNTIVPNSVYKNMDIIDTILYLKKNKLFCTCCAKVLNVKDIALTHFSAIFCDTCAKKYKKDNEGKCSKCNKPLYDCYC